MRNPLAAIRAQIAQITPRHRNQLRVIPFLLCALIVYVAIIQGQGKPVADIAPVAIKHLSPDASARWIELEKAQTDIVKEANRQLSDLEGQKQGIRLGAEIPKTWEPFMEGGIVTFKPKPTP